MVARQVSFVNLITKITNYMQPLDSLCLSAEEVELLKLVTVS